MKKYIKILFLLLLFLGFYRPDNVSAVDTFPSTINPIAGIELNYSTHKMIYKVLEDDTEVYCLDWEKNAPTRICNLVEQDSESTMAGLAAIIDSVEHRNFEQYYWASMAVHYYMEDNYGYVNEYHTSKVQQYLDKALLAESSVDGFAISASVDSDTLTRSDDYFVSDVISVNVSYGDGYSVTLSSSDAEVINKTDNSFQIRIPVNSVDATSDFNVTATIKTTQSYKVAARYDCGYDYQTISPDILKDVTKQKSVQLTFKGHNPSITIIKKDGNNKVLSGAKLQILDSNNTLVYQWTSTTSTYNIENMVPGTYTLREVTAPSGYKLLTNDIKFTVTEDSTLTLQTQTPEASVDGNNLTIYNLEKIKISIIKKDENDKPLSGAKLEILNGNGTVLYQWTSTEEAYSIEGIAPGTYTLRETTAPDGYKLLTNDIKFTVSQNGTLTLETSSSSAAVSGSNLTIYNLEKIKFSISKVDINRNPLSGATLQILDSNGNEFKDNNGNVLYKWVSTDTPHYIEGLAAGTYILREIEAPAGYELLNKDIVFTLSSLGIVTMKDKITDAEAKDSGLIVFNLEKTKLSISKQDITTGKELPGATLQILDNKGNEIKDKDGNVLYKWVSTDTPYYIEGLPAGKYWLVEILAPNGYVLNEERIEFELKNNGEIVSVVMKNTPIVDVPKTDFNASSFIISIGIIAIISGAIFVGLNVKRQNQ